MIQLCSDYHIRPDFWCDAGAALPIVLRTLGIIMLHNLHLDQYKDSRCGDQELKEYSYYSVTVLVKVKSYPVTRYNI